eukprot:327275_1
MPPKKDKKPTAEKPTEEPPAATVEETQPKPSTNPMDNVNVDAGEKHIRRVLEDKEKDEKTEHTFWSTQPVLKYDQGAVAIAEGIGPLETKTVAEVNPEPY